MYIIKNALSNIRCSKGRNILLGIIILVIAVASCIALSVKEAAKKAETEGLKNLTVTASISYNRENLMQNSQNGNSNFREQMQKIKELSMEEMLIYSQSNYVNDFLYHVSTSINISGIDPVENESVSNTANNGSTNGKSGNDNDKRLEAMPEGGQFNFSQGDFTITGYSSYSAMTDFINGNSTITEGEIFDFTSDEYQCVISTELAAYNNLQVGNTVTIVNPNNETQKFTFTITGLYTYTSTTSNNGFNARFSTAMDAANQIYTTFNTLNAVITYTKDNATTSTTDNGVEQSTALRESTSGTYIFSSVDNYNSFAEDVKTMGLSSDYIVQSTDVTNYESSLIPIQNTAKFANTMLWIVLAIGGAILIVFNIFNIRERKYEVGVLTAIGMKKSKVALQFVIELLIVTFIAIFIGTGIGAVSSIPISNSLLESQISAQESKATQQSNNFGNPGQKIAGIPGSGNMDFNRNPSEQQSNKAVEYISYLNASTDLSVVLQLMGIGLLLSIISSLVSVVFVMRYEPLKILSERT
ncbi:MAG: ABC transporter permease [Clostridiales bacterium]|nr:MAG: ABC transporter permease [Clostridiales bacterium]